MQRFIDAVGWFIEAMGKCPVEDGIGFYRDIEFPNERWESEFGGPEPGDDEREARRLASY